MKTTIVLCLLVAVVALLIIGKVSHTAVSLIVLSVLTIGKIITNKETLAQLANPTMMLYVGSFVISAAFTKVGLTKKIGLHLVGLTRHFAKYESLTLFIIALSTAILSIFLQAMGVQIILMTIIVTIAEELKISRKKALFSLGFSATIGGTFTLLGNNVDLLAKSAYEAANPNGRFGLFEMSPYTIPAGLLLLAFYAFVSSRWIKDGKVTCTKNETSTPIVQVTENPHLTSKQIFVLVYTALFLLAVFLDGKTAVPANVAVLLIMLFMGWTKVLTPREILDSINWNVVLFAVGILTLSSSIVQVGIGDSIASFTLTHVQKTMPLRGYIAILFISTTTMTQFMSNAASFGVMCPIAITISQMLGIDAKPLILAVCIGANTAFATPMATPSYPMLAEAGNLSFREFFLEGIVLVIINAVLSIIFIPIIWG